MRNRIKTHRRVRAGDLVPHEMNPRVHSDAQRRALKLLYDEIGFARSLLAYELPDGRLKLIDGHLRRDITPEEELDVEVLDVSDAEARALLLAIDPLAQMAGYEENTLAELRRVAEKDSAAVRTLWELLKEESRRTQRQLDADAPPQRFCIIIECEDEAQQLQLLTRFQQEGLNCHPKIG